MPAPSQSVDVATTGSQTDDLRPWFTALHELSGTIDWADYFGNSHPVELDIGCGRGRFVVDRSIEEPDRNWLGIEIEFREGRHAARRLAKRRLPNARIWGGDAMIALRKHIGPASVDAAHVYFPDPWWKNKHRQRRIFTDTLTAELARALKPGGEVHSWTDVGEYFEVIAALMNHHPQFVPLPPPESSTPSHDLDYRTSFERKRRKAGATIWRGRWQRVDD